MAAPEAIERLRERELRPAIEPDEVDDPARHACVLDQHPPAGERVRHGQLVMLIVGQHTPPSAAVEVPLPAHDAPAVDREPIQPATRTVHGPSSAMPASAASLEDESEPQAVAEEPEPELVVIPAGWQPIPDDPASLAPLAGRARGGGVASRRGRRRRRRWVAVLAVVLALLAGLSLLAGQRRAAGSHAVGRAVSSVRSDTSGTSSTTPPATSAPSAPPATVPSAAARAAGPRPARRRRTDEHHHPKHRAAVSAPPAGAASASTPASAPVAPVAGAPESSPPAPALTSSTPAPALTTPRAATAPAGSGVVVVPPSATGPLAGPYPNQ